MEEPKKCSFMIGSDVISISPPNKTTFDQDSEDYYEDAFFRIGSSSHDLESSDTAWLTEILLTRRRTLSAPVFSAASHRRFTALKRRLLRRSLPPICEVESPFTGEDNCDDEDEGCYGNSSSSSFSSDSSSPRRFSDAEAFARHWNKLRGGEQEVCSSPSFQVISQTSDAPICCYELFSDQYGCKQKIQQPSDDVDEGNCEPTDVDLFADDLSERLEIEASAKRRDQQQYSYHRKKSGVGVVGQHRPKFA